MTSESTHSPTAPPDAPAERGGRRLARSIAFDWRGRFVIATLIACYLFWFRVHGLSDSFALLGEQQRDWSVAQRSFDNLPWIGPRSLNSGLDIGPVYYRFLWLCRVLLGPLADNLPHAGGWGIAALQSVADACLFLALWQALASGFLAGLAVIAAATSPFDAHFSATIWNPPVAVAFVKLSSAALLWRARPGNWALTVAIICASLAVQAHFTAIFVAAPIVTCALIVLWRDHGRRAAVVGVFAFATVTAAWVLPYLAAAPQHPPQPQPVGPGAIGSVLALLHDPTRLRVAESAAAVGDALEIIFGQPFNVSGLRWLIVAAAVLTILSRDVKIVATGLAPLCAAVSAFSLWQGSFGETYWFLVIAPAAAICLATALACSPRLLRPFLLVPAVVGMISIQPARAHMTWTESRTPEYGQLVSGARAIVQHCGGVRSIATEFPVPASMDVYFVHELLGGKLDPNGPEAHIRRNGSATCSLPDAGSQRP